jgi:hypothetical protein
MCLTLYWDWRDKTILVLRESLVNVISDRVWSFLGAMWQEKFIYIICIIYINLYIYPLISFKVIHAHRKRF